MAPALVGAAVLAVVVVVFVLVMRNITGKMRERGRAEIARGFPHGGTLASEPLAITLGLESKGHLQVSGNGALVLTRDEIWFSQIDPPHILRIPIGSVLNVSLVAKHRGHSMGRDLVQVRYRTGETEDAVAWYVPKPAEWKSSIEAVRLGR